MKSKLSYPSVYPLDQRAVKILFDCYWTNGKWKLWRDRTLIAPEDYEYAIANGTMFPPRTYSHGDTITETIELARKTDRKQVSDAFLASLATHRMDWRSPLACLIVAKRLRKHTFVSSSSHGTFCDVCGESAYYPNADISVLNFERLKYGGVRHVSPYYITFDLARFHESDRPSSSDVQQGAAVFCKIIRDIQKLPEKSGASDVVRLVSKVLHADVHESRGIAEILGICSVLETPEYPGFLRRFTHASQRDIPAFPRTHLTYPVCWWRRPHGVNFSALRTLFPELKERLDDCDQAE
ncbi:MAG: hypothetical protein HZA46_18625 [Planctomycetales bacterium]|nr:hypothetical protein [Planctomycetales bacterium]